MISALLPSFLPRSCKTAGKFALRCCRSDKEGDVGSKGRKGLSGPLSHSAQSDEPELLLGRSYPSYATI